MELKLDVFWHSINSTDALEQSPRGKNVWIRDAVLIRYLVLATVLVWLSMRI